MKKSLISVSTIGLHNNEKEIHSELHKWFGDKINDWNLLQQKINGIHICRDYTTSSSIHDSMYLGRLTAKQVITN